MFPGGGLETNDREKKAIRDGITEMKWIEDNDTRETERGGDHTD